MKRRLTFVIAAVLVAGCRSAQAPHKPVEARPAGLPAVEIAGASKPPRRQGLLASYDDGATRVETLAEAPAFALRADESVHPALRPVFRATWTGNLEIAEAGEYRFWAAPAALFVDERAVGDAPLALSAGRHRVRIEYQRAPGDAQLQIQWSSETFAREPLPAALLSNEAWSNEAETWSRIDHGRALWDERGCRGCHLEPGDDGGSDTFVDAVRRGRGPNLTSLGTRLHPGWIFKWLENPGRVRAGAHMPIVLKSAQERADVTALLVSLREAGSTTEASLPVIDTAPLGDEEEQQARTLFDSIGCIACHGEGQVPLANLGSKYTPAGLLRVLLRADTVSHSGRMPNMGLSEDEAELLARLLLQEHDRGLEQAPPGGDARRGQALLEERGCLGCHIAEREGRRFVTKLAATTPARLRPGRGCLADTSDARAPDHALSARERADLNLFLAAGRDVSPAPLWQLARSLDHFGCRNCHEVDGPPRHSFDDKPPSLRDVGNKLRPEWLSRVVSHWNGPRIRPWIKLRMPSYHKAESLGDWFAAAAGAPRKEPAMAKPPSASERVVQEGVQYLGRGEGGMSCVVCHRFGEFDPHSATPAPDLTTAARRLRPQWFSRWLRDPLRMAPGTQMPAFFAGVDHDFSESRIQALWQALSLGERMPTPIGVDLSGSRMAIVPGAKPEVVRTFVEGGVPRSIVVGVRDRAYAYDTEACRLQFAWSGDFLDMKPVWAGRGGEPALLLGDRFYGAPAAGPDKPARGLLRIGSDGDEKRPVRFRGYDLDRAGWPAFRYQIGTTQVSEHISFAPAPALGLVHRFTIDRPDGAVWIVAPDDAGITVAVEGAQVVAPGRYRVAPAGKRPLRITVKLTASRGGGLTAGASAP